MISKFALAFKTKTIEFFADEDEDEDDADADSASVLSAPDELIPDQRVVVLKPDPKPEARPEISPETLVPAVFAAVSAFRAAYLQLQSAHSPFDSLTSTAADAAAVSHLRQISDLKREFFRNPNPNPNLKCPSFLEAQVQENQSLLRTFENVFKRLESDYDRKDLEANELRKKLKELEGENLKLARNLRREGEKKVVFTVGLFDSVVREFCRSVHRFSKLVVGFLKKERRDFGGIYPNVRYLKPGHCKYAVMSCICLRLFNGFDESESGGIQRSDSLREFTEHFAVVDSVEVIRENPGCDFAKFCVKKYEEVVGKCRESDIFGCLDKGLEPSNPLYRSFIEMASLLWSLQKLARAYEPGLEIFQVERGKEFLMVFMDSVLKMEDYGMGLCPRVGFTVVPGFRIGKTVIQCRVYLERVKEAL